MRSKDYVDPAQKLWSSSKCQRILRPLRLKLTALERALTTSYSVSDGIRPWSDFGTSRSRKPNHDFITNYVPTSTKLRKYGNARKQAAANRFGLSRDENVPSIETTLTSLRTCNSPSLGSAYLGVYNAFTAILDKVSPIEEFPSLASRAGLVVGQCIHLTGHPFTSTSIEPDDWYEACPAHMRGPVVVGHAVQMLISSRTILAPMMSALILTLKDNPIVVDLMDAVLEDNSFLTSRKSDLEGLQHLANMIGTPWAIRAHLTKTLEFRHLLLPAFTSIARTKADEELDDYSLALYIKANLIATIHLRREQSSSDVDDVRLGTTLRALSRRILLSNDQGTISYFCELYRFSNKTICLPLALAYNLAALALDPANVNTIATMTNLTSALVKLAAEEKDECITYLTQAFPDARLAFTAELLVGRCNDLALLISAVCARMFEGDYIEWADRLHSDVVSNQITNDSDKYRFEPLLDAWVTRTPGLPKMRKSRNVEAEEESDDNAASSIDEAEYYADQSSTQLPLQEMYCEDHDDLLTSKISPIRKVPSSVRKILSDKPGSLLKSAKLAQRYRRLSGDKTLQGSPCDGKQALQQSSPLHHIVSKRRMLVGSENSSPIVKRRRHVFKKDNAAIKKRTRHTLREVKNLECSFMNKKRWKPLRTWPKREAIEVDDDNNDEKEDSDEDDLVKLPVILNFEADDIDLL